jgi:hypothetical protein
MPTFDATTLLRNPTNNGAVSASGLTSLLGTNPTQIAAKTAAEEAAKAGAAKFGLGTLMQGLGPLYAAYSVLDLLGFFDSTLQETPMTPEERAELEATSRLALAKSGMQEGGEGAYETLMDAVGQAAQTGLLSNKDIGVSGKWYDPETGKELPDFDPKTGEGMGTLFPTFYPDPVQPAGGGGGGGNTTASDAAASDAAASDASSQADSGIAGTDKDDSGNVKIVGRQLYEAIGAEKDPALKDALIKEYETYTGQKYDPTSKPTAPPPTDQEVYGTTTDTTTTTANSGASNTGLGLPSVLYLPDFGGTSTAGALTLPTSTTGTGTTGTGTTGTGTTGTGTTGTGTTGTGTTGTGTTNIGGTGGGLSTGTGDGDGTGTGTGTGSGDGDGDGDGAGDGTGDGSDTGEGEDDTQALADILGGGMRGVATEQAGVADIAVLYDPSLSLAENMARILGKDKNEQADAVDNALMYAGGTVQNTDLNDEVLRILGGR